MAVHHHFYKGKRIFIILKSGETKIGKYIGSTAKGLNLDIGFIPFENIRSSGYNIKELNKGEKDG